MLDRFQQLGHHGLSAYILTGNNRLGGSSGSPRCSSVLTSLKFALENKFRRLSSCLSFRQPECSTYSFIIALRMLARSKGWTDLVTLLSVLSNRSTPLVLRFSLTTITPVSGVRTDLQTCRYCTICSSLRWPRHHCVQIRSYVTPSRGCHSSRPQLKMCRTPVLPFKASVNLAIGSTTSTCSATRSRTPSVTLPILRNRER